MPGRHGVTRAASDLQPCQDLSTSYKSEFRHVGCLRWCCSAATTSYAANNALTAYRALRAAGNDDLQQGGSPRLDHYVPLRPDRAAVGAVSVVGLGNR